VFASLTSKPTTLSGYGIVDAQPLDATLTALAGSNWQANSVPIGLGADTAAQVTFAANTFPARGSSGNLVAKPITDFVLTILDDGDAATVRTTIGAGTSNFSGAVADLTGLGTGVGAALAVSVVGSGGIVLATNPALGGVPTAPTAAPGTNTTQIATTAFTIAEIASSVTGLLSFVGSTDCSTNPNYPAASKGDGYIVSVAGKIGGASGVTVAAGDVYFATVDNAGGTQAAVGSSWTVLHSTTT